MKPILMLVLTLVAVNLRGQVLSDPTMEKIVIETFYKSRVVDYAWQLSGLQGPRVTGSPAFKEAAERLIADLDKKGVKVWKEPWGDFGSSWSYQHHGARLIEPFAQTLNSLPYAWSPSTKGEVSGFASYAPFPQTQIDPKRLEAVLDRYVKAYSGRLKGKVVLMDSAQPIRLVSTNQPFLLDPKALADLVLPSAPCPVFSLKFPLPLPGTEESRCYYETATREAIDTVGDLAKDTGAALRAFYQSEGVVAVVRASRGAVGRVIPSHTNSRKPEYTLPLPEITLAAEDYNQVVGLISKRIPVELALETKSEFYAGETFNVIAEIEGQRVDEVVMIGAHLDSSPFGSGASDNASGAATLWEVLRTFKALGEKPLRTIRFCFWSGEEQGLLGSRAYVRRHAGEIKRIRVYLNLDFGPGKIRGIYLNGNQELEPALMAWLASWKASGSANIAKRNFFLGGRSDHESFQEAGVPGLVFFQDPLGHPDLVWHTPADRFELLAPHAMNFRHNAAVVAWVAYQAANRR